LEEVIQERPVLLNRAPTLHRLGIQAFEPVLVEGSAIQLHPLVTTAFNADFDGDQMAVHVPLSEKAVWEARQLMLSTKNILKPADGEPIISPAKDMVLGVYYLTKTHKEEHDGDGRIFATMDEVALAYQLDQVHIHADIKLWGDTWYDDQGNRLLKPQSRMIDTTVGRGYDDQGNRMLEPQSRMIDTTVGRVLFNQILPPEIQFVNMMLDKGGIKDLVAELYEIVGEDNTPEIADAIKDIGFAYATRSGYSLAISDITVPITKEEIINDALQKAELVSQDFSRGLLTEQERDERQIEIWQQTTNLLANEVREAMDPDGNLAAQAISGATKGGFGTISQLAGMRGLMADPSGRIIPLPIRSNFREGLTALEYFISTHGARKGLADTALRTADAGYLTRRLVDVAQDIIINDDDCETLDGIVISRKDNVAGQSISTRLFGRLLTERVVDPETGEIIAERNELLNHKIVRRIVSSNVEEVKVRSPLTCELIHGVCANCYGLDLGRGDLIAIGSAVGIVAAQSIGEPGTQLTLRTFHTGGVAAGADITTGLPRVEELFEARKQPKGEAVVTEIGGKTEVTLSDRYSDLRIIRVSDSEMVSDQYDLPEEWTIAVEDASEVEQGDELAYLVNEEGEKESTVTSQNAGRVRIEDVTEDDAIGVIVSYEITQEAEYPIPSTSRILVENGEHVEAGQPLTEGSLNPHTILRIQGRLACQRYLLTEVQKVYRSQGQNIKDKHFEVIIRKMMSKVEVTRPGDSDYLPSDLVDYLELRNANDELLAEGKRPAESFEVLLGITKASLNTESFLSASSFQHTIKVLAQAAIAGLEDPLYGLKENVIIGKLIPAGTGFKRGRFDNLEGETAESFAILDGELSDELATGAVEEEESISDIELSPAD
jgi:DNA-directed RNA polymerase subunit beta'